MIDKYLLYEQCMAMGVELSLPKLEAFDRFAGWLTEWNKSINLTSITEPEEILYKHFADSVSILAMTEFPQGATVIDVGTGGGFPGLPMLIARPDLKMVLLDSTQKKLMFVDRVLKGLSLNGKTLHSRAEDAGRQLEYRGAFDFAVSRAVANLRDLSEYCLPFVKENGYFIAPKGQKAKEELGQAKKAIATLGGKIEAVKSFRLGDMGERNTVVVKKISRTPPYYPRSSAKIAKEPLE